LLSKRKEDASYTKSDAGGGTTANVVAREKKRPAVVKEQHDEQPILQRDIVRCSVSPGKKKARYGSGLNLSLEENRGDMLIMLHRKKEIQFSFAMSAIAFIND
jgi:hypothetical protein